MKIAVQWPRFGPYHLARLEACERVLGPRGIEVIGLETASNDTLYDWNVEDGPVRFRREQVFPGQTFEALAPRAIEAGVAQALDRIDPDAVSIMSYGYPDARAALAWCRRRRRVAILTTDTKADDAPRVGWREWIKRRIVAEYDAAFVSGTPQRAYLEALGFPADRIVAGCNVVDNAFFTDRAALARQDPGRTRHLPGLNDDAPFFLAVNRFLPFKNLDGLVHAYARYRAEAERPWRLLLIGDGPDRDRIEALVAAEGVHGVEFCGFQQVDDVALYLGRASAFVHPSHKDTWGLVANEAMAAGLPVVISRQSGCWMDLVDAGRNGFTFDSTDLDALTQHLIAVSRADLGAMGERSREIIAGYTPERFAEGLIAAVELGRPRADRRPAFVAQALLGVLRATSRSVTAFHSADL